MAIGVGIGLSVVSGVMQARAQYSQAKAQEANLNYNAQLSENQAEQVQSEAVENTIRGRNNSDQQLATARARMAAQGTVSNTGSQAEVLSDIAGELEIGILDNYRTAQVQRNSLLNQAQVTRQEAKSVGSSGKLMAFSTLLSTAGSVAGSVGNAKASGALDTKNLLK